MIWGDVDVYNNVDIEKDVVIRDDIDNNWYETMLGFMIILIWDDVVINDYVDMRCCYWWLC